MKCLVFTFGLNSINSNKVVIINCNNITSAINYVFKKYGSENICSHYHYDKKSLKIGCAWKSGLFEKIKSDYDYGKNLIKKYKYEIMEEITLED